MAREARKYVKIQSNMTIRVTGGLQFDDYTKRDSDIPNRLKVAPEWPKLMVLIQVGQHTYPSEIVNWSSVRALQEKGILTIGEFTDDEADNVAETKAELNRAIEQIKSKSLADIAGE